MPAEQIIKLVSPYKKTLIRNRLTEAYSLARNKLQYDEAGAYSEPCQTSKIERFVKKLTAKSR